MFSTCTHKGIHERRIVVWGFFKISDDKELEYSEATVSTRCIEDNNKQFTKSNDKSTFNQAIKV